MTEPETPALPHLVDPIDIDMDEHAHVQVSLTPASGDDPLVWTWPVRDSDDVPPLTVTEALSGAIDWWVTNAGQPGPAHRLTLEPGDQIITVSKS